MLSRFALPSASSRGAIRAGRKVALHPGLTTCSSSGGINSTGSEVVENTAENSISHCQPDFKDKMSRISVICVPQ
ncbi:hypothetical protein GWI33_010232 [Rhynchophorus ferrugineus]|uniref:Uncharacterized protein n=1 Tax=Rhynchophorus ferrugineus TaxID=354439 RepID=A0A834IEB9_RHYFE|nr:hypothetical protein GWI33_010232 [Rhynchophorus ferrugineus]